MRIVVEITADVLHVGIAQHPAHRAIGGGAHGLVDFLSGGVAVCLERQVNHGHVGGGDADRDAVQLAVQLGQDQAHGLGRAGRGGDHAGCRRTCAVEIRVVAVQRGLVAGIAVDRGHEPALDPDGVVQHLGHRRQTVCGAGRVRHDQIITGQGIVIHTEHDGLVRIGRGGRTQHALRSVLEMQGRAVTRVERAGTFQRHVDPVPRQAGRIAVRGERDRSATHIKSVALNLDFIRETSVNAIEPQQVGIGFDRGRVVDRHDLNVVSSAFNHGAQDIASDASKAVDRYFDGHAGGPYDR